MGTIPRPTGGGRTHCKGTSMVNKGMINFRGQGNTDRVSRVYDQWITEVILYVIRRSAWGGGGVV